MSLPVSLLESLQIKFQVISLFPEMILSGLKEGIIAGALHKKILSVECVNPRKFTTDIHHSVDDRPYGGGDGMVMMPEPLEQSILHFRSLNMEPECLIYLSARGEPFDDQMARELALKKTLTLICGRYGGVDQRFLSKNNIREVCIGDYILSGGELGALVIIDAVARHIRGVLGNNDSANEDSFAQGLLEAPAFTRSQDWHDLGVPKILLSGDHQKINQWRFCLSVLSTAQNRPDLFFKKDIDNKKLLEAKKILELMDDEEKYICGLHQSEKILKCIEQKLQS
jgi:tRNA (guanine37-N1)-methyltransferase